MRFAEDSVLRLDANLVDLPAWVTGLAFISANLGAIEIMGMSANGAASGMPTVHYFWVGAIPAMLFLVS